MVKENCKINYFSSLEQLFIHNHRIMSLTDSLLINMGSLQSSDLLICMTLSSSYSSCSALEMCEIAEIFRRLLKYGQKKYPILTSDMCIHIHSSTCPTCTQNQKYRQEDIWEWDSVFLWPHRINASLPRDGAH